MIDRNTRDRIVRRLRIQDHGGRECRYCSTWYLPHPGFADHQDVCEFNPLNRPHICGTANAPGVLLKKRVVINR